MEKKQPSEFYSQPYSPNGRECLKYFEINNEHLQFKKNMFAQIPITLTRPTCV